MNKVELAGRVSDTVGVPRAEVVRVLDAALEEITKGLGNGEEIRLVNFGSFSVTRRSATRARVPQTDKVIDIPESFYPKFRPGKALKDAVNARRP